MRTWLLAAYTRVFLPPARGHAFAETGCSPTVLIGYLGMGKQRQLCRYLY